MFPKSGLQITAAHCSKENQNISVLVATVQCILEVKNRIKIFFCMKMSKNHKIFCWYPALLSIQSATSRYIFPYLYLFLLLTFFSNQIKLQPYELCYEIRSPYETLYETAHSRQIDGMIRDYYILFSRRRGCDYYFLPIVQQQFFFIALQAEKQSNMTSLDLKKNNSATHGPK